MKNIGNTKKKKRHCGHCIQVNKEPKVHINALCPANKETCSEYLYCSHFHILAIVCGCIVSVYTPVLINKPSFKPYLPLTDYTVIQAQRKLVSTEY